MSPQKMVGLRPEQKELLDETKEKLKDQNGDDPTLGETVATACETLQNVEGL